MHVIRTGFQAMVVVALVGILFAVAPIIHAHIAAGRTTDPIDAARLDAGDTNW